MNDFLDRVSEFLSKYPGLLPLIGLGLIILNLILQLFPGSWFVDRHILLHLGLIISLIGLLLIRPLS
ncbi:hypothetical protein [Candidatus Leptofilum sp.]|uniref:hypothetical protein n=1 Tax=Candidatus Leptofilum sp. TaxID=3241576 RepID=UPI003B5ABAEB